MNPEPKINTPYSHAVRAARRIGWRENDARDYAYLRRQGERAYDAWSIVRDGDMER